MSKAIILTAALSLALAPALAHAQTAPDQVIATTQAIGGPYAGCLLAIENRETGGTFDPNAYNPASGAVGPLQYLQSGGIWSDGPDADTPVTVASVAEQIAVAVWALASGYGSAWAPLPASCVGG